MLEAIRDDPAMAEDIIAGAEYVRVELYYAAQTEMITTLEDFLRRRSKIALVLSYEEIRDAAGIHEACRLLFGDEADKRYAEYFTPEREEEARRCGSPTLRSRTLRWPLPPARPTGRVLTDPVGHGGRRGRRSVKLWLTSSHSPAWSRPSARSRHSPDSI